jgi:hypothetical protein
MRKLAGEHTMTSRKSIGIVLVAIASVTALSLAYVGAQGTRDTGPGPASQRTYVDVDAGRKELPAGAHGKIAPPAEIQVTVADAGEPGGPVRLAIDATSLVPVRLATISLTASQVGAEPEPVEALWSAATTGIIGETIDYTTDPLSAGEYRFTVVLEFVPDGTGDEALFVAESLCLDVGPDTVYASAVSFNHIKRIRLLQELEDRALISLKPQLARADRKTMARALANIEARQPGTIDRKIAEIKATDPDVARRIEQLNRIKDEPATKTMKNITALSETEVGQFECHFPVIAMNYVTVLNRPADGVYLPGDQIELESKITNLWDIDLRDFDREYTLTFRLRGSFGFYGLGALNGDTLLALQSLVSTTSWTIPDSVIYDHYVVVATVSCAASYDQVCTDSEISSSIRVGPLAADLGVQSVDAANGRYQAGDPILIRCTVGSTGDIGSNAYTVDFYASTDAEVDTDDVWVGSSARSALEHNHEDTFESIFTLPVALPDGPHYIGAFIDYPDDRDSSDNGGMDSWPIWVGPFADLTVQNVGVTAGTYAPSDAIVVYSLIENIGDSAVEAYTIDYYASADDSITSEDHHIGYAERAGLAPGQQHSYETTCQLPPYLPVGNCYIGAIVTSPDDGRADNDGGRIETPVTVIHPAGYVCGQVLYKDRPGRQHPVRYAQVEIYEGQDEPGDPEIARTHTDASGYFGMVMPQAEGQDRPVYVKVRTKGVSGAYPGTTSAICEVRDGVLETPYLFRSLLYELPADESLTISMIVPNTSGGFTAYDSVVEGFHKAKTFFGIELDPVTTYCPSPYNGTFYIPGEASIHISEDDWGDRDVILHEYGHFLAEACNFAQGEVGEYNQHYWNSDLRWTPRSHSNAQAQFFAFREAWPTLFSIATQYGDTWYPSAGDTKYQDRVIWANWTFEIDLEKDTEAHDSPGRYFENMNCCALWDIFDDHDDLVDNNDVLSDTSLAKIWTVTQACHPNDIEEFWYGWFQHFDHEEEVTRIFLDHEMPFLMMPTATGTDFETGDFSIFEWQDTSDTPWIITSEGAYEGAYCARAGAIGDSQSSTLDMTMDCQDGEISFWRKVSSEEDWDKLQFYLDGQRKGNWSGELDWEHASYPVKAGMHRFRWIYVKSGFDSHGEDSAWIDNIEFPVVGTAP